MATDIEIRGELEALSTHCRAPLMETNQRALWLRDWCADLAVFPIDAIRAACRRYRNSDATKFPTPGQLLPLVKSAAKPELREGVKALPWAPSGTQEAYNALSLTEKIYENRALAKEAYRKAGPMWKHGRPVGPEELGPAWRGHTDQAKAYEAEATRLSKYLREKPTAVAAE